MSSLYKLSISGVRSFSPKDHETIQFGSPLTLICGQNGCGKTTIIESLKYATTGDLPPNSKGGAFVNDPTIADRLVVNAEIKLGFISVDGKLMTVTRNMQLNRKRAVRGSSTASNTFKSLEGQLAVVSRGEKTSISTKNLELDTRVPLYLGASKAILEYVIFCHQDDSLWPLSEAGVLKKRFDEIFEALKFTKVLDNLKSIRKDMAGTIKLVEQSVQHAKSDKDRALKVKARLLDLLATAEKYLAEIADLTVQIERLERQANELFHSNQAFQQTLSEHERLRLLVESTKNAMARLESSITILRDPDDELSRMAANFADVKREKQLQLSLVEAAGADLEKELLGLQQTYHSLVRDEGLLSAKREQYQADLEAIKRLRQEKSLETDDTEGNFSNHDACNRLSSQVEELQHDHVRFMAANSAKTAQARDSLQAATDKLHKEQERASFCREETANSAAKIKQAKAQLASLSANEESLEMERSQLEGLRRQLDKRKAAQNTQIQADEIENDNKKILALEHESDELMRRIHQANKLTDLLSKAEVLRESRDVKLGVLDRFMGAHRTAFSGIFGVDIDAASAEKLVEAKRKECAQQLAQFQAESSELQAEVNRAETEMKSGERNVAGVKEKLRQHSARVLAVVEEGEIAQYETLVRDLEEDYNTAVYNLNTFEVTKSYKTKALQMAKTSRCCALCNRGMDPQELATFVRDIEANVAATTADKLKVDVEDTARDLHVMKLINADVLEYRRLTRELGKLEKDALTAADKCTDAQSRLEKAGFRVQDAQRLLDSVDVLSRPVADMARLHEEVQGLERQISDLDSELNELGVSSESMNELQKQQQQKSFELKTLRQSVADAVHERNTRQKETARLEYQLKEKELFISKMQLSLSEALGLKHELARLENHSDTLRAQAKSLETKVLELKAEQKQCQMSFERVEKECEESGQVSMDSLTSAKNKLDAFKQLLARVDRYEQVDAQRVAENEHQMLETRQKIDHLHGRKKATEEEARGLQKFVNDAASTERNIKDNLELRDTERQLQQQQESLHQLDIAHAEAEKEQYQNKANDLRAQTAQLNEVHYGKIGEMKQIKDQMQALQHELDSDFANVDKHYHDEYIKLQTNLLVSTDLQTYSQALDNAIMKYHSMKMDEINRILRELWTQTYRGTDIDGIEIKCDVTNQTRGRSYNYRVVMYKKSSELDMRGRCSAGQKVLTSILIRLALAECFGSNCGMIALDEPTTNLDVENAESLANALSNIIELRKAQKNFQLIVITHDEKFLNHINGGRFVDNFYRIERDEKQHSIIKSLPIHVMQEE